MPLQDFLFETPHATAQKDTAACQKTQVSLSNEDACMLVGPEALFTFAQNPQGLTLIGCNIHAFARDAGLINKRLTLILPAHINGKTLTRIAADAFRPWLSYDVHLSLIVIPEGVTDLADNALSPLCAETIAIPSTLAHFGTQPFSRKAGTKSIDGRTFIVTKGNSHYKAINGSLYEMNAPDSTASSGERLALISCALPHPESLRLPESTCAIASAAFAQDAEAPAEIICPAMLQNTQSLLPNTQQPALTKAAEIKHTQPTLWVCQPESAFARFARTQGLLAVSPGYVKQDGYVYDFARGEASLVCCPLSTPDLHPNASVDGSQLTSIRSAALPAYADSLAIPQGVRAVQNNNPCCGLAHLFLPEGLASIGSNCFTQAQPDNVIRIPASVIHIGEASFAGSVIRFAALDCTVHVPFNPPKTLFNARSSENGTPFDLQAYDKMLADSPWQSTQWHSRLTAIIDRLAGTPSIEPLHMMAFAHLLERCSKDACLERLAKTGSIHAIERLRDAGYFKTIGLDYACEAFRKMHRTEFVAALMQNAANQTQTARARFAL